MWETQEEKDEVPLKIVKKVGISFNLRKNTCLGLPDDIYEEYDCMETIDAISKELENYGFEVCLLEQDAHFLEKINYHKPDFIFNIAEGIGNTRGRESQVPSILESLGIPYSGSDGVTLALTLDKYLTHRVLTYSGVKVPSFYLFSCEEDLEIANKIFEVRDMYIVKPRWEGSSKGIFPDSVANNADELKEKVKRIWVRYKEPALVEEYLSGDEITVGVAGNSQLRILGMMRIVPTLPQNSHFLYSLKHKREWESLVDYQGPESIDSHLKEELSEIAKKVFAALELRDIARIDFRLDANGNPHVIDVNPLPGLSPYYSDLIILYRMSGGKYNEIIKTILKESFLRNNLYWCWG